MSIYVWGMGKQCLGVPVDRELVCATATRVPGIPPCIDADCGESCTAVVTQDGTILCWGTNRYGRLGRSETECEGSDTPVVVRLPPNEKAAKVSVGENHLGCVCHGGNVYLWGNGTRGCLGDGVVASHKSHEPRRLELPGPAREISCGFQSTLVLLEDGSVWSFGSNEDGKLGLGLPASTEAWATPRQVPLPVPARAIAAGSCYAGAVGTDGSLFMWGYGKAGNLGLGTRVASVSTPERVKGIGGVASVACTRGQINFDKQKNIEGCEQPHTFAVCEDGTVYAFGTCHKGMLGNLTLKSLSPKGCDELSPYRIGSEARDGKREPTRYLEGAVATCAASASIHSVIAVKNMGAVAFGCGSDGRMGTWQYLEGLHGSRSRMKCYVSAPTTLVGMESKNVVKVASSRRHNVALVAE